MRECNIFGNTAKAAGGERVFAETARKTDVCKPFHDCPLGERQPSAGRMVDDSKVILSEGVAILEEALPNATIAGFIWPREAIEYAKMNRIAMAVLDIELGASSGLDLCHTLLEINPHTNIIFLTAYADYSLDAWQTGASGFILKPMTPESLKEQMNKLRYPLSMAGAEDRVIASL